MDVTNIWVAEGDYFPSVPISRDASFTLRDSVKIYGGFVGTETLLEDRTGNETIVRLSGDLGVPNDSLDNAYHVIQIDPSCVDCVINSLTIKFGQGDGVNELFILADNQVYQPSTNPIGRDTNAILEEIMGTSKRPQVIEDLSEQYFSFINQQLWTDAENTKRQLLAILDATDPIFARAEALISRKKMLTR